MKRTWLPTASLVAAITLLAAACGGDDTADDATATTATGTQTATATTETATTGTASTSSDTAGSEAAANEGDGQLVIGTLLPETGSLAFLGPPEFAGAELAVNEINEAGGVLDTEVQLIQGDSGDTTTDIANQTVDRLLSQNADAIIGAASSAVSFTVIDKIVNAGVVQFSPANTSKRFSDYDDDGLYFRTAPSDILQGQVLGELIIEDGAATVGIMALQDPYGEGLADDIQASVESSGGEVTNKIIYDPQAQNFDAEAQQLADSNPDAIAVIGFDETARILTTLFERGIGADSKPLYGSDGNMGNALGENFEDNPEAIAGMKGTTPLSELREEFRQELLEIDPELVDFNYAAETYDAIVIVALATLLAGTDEPTEFAEEIPGVTGGGDVCTSFGECKQLIEAGTTDIDYDGVSGPIELDEAGDPQRASYAILQFNENAELETLEYRLAQAS